MPEPNPLLDACEAELREKYGFGPEGDSLSKIELADGTDITLCGPHAMSFGELVKDLAQIQGLL